jgi:glycosyltransferase involved in cell wall biosynthesis
MPTTIIELGVRGMAVVASAVGGVPELIGAETGWAIPPQADATIYVAALREALDSPAEAVRRAEALQSLVANRHTEAIYDASLEALLSGEPAPWTG